MKDTTGVYKIDCGPPSPRYGSSHTNAARGKERAAKGRGENKFGEYW